jgi:hypothetical protein
LRFAAGLTAKRGQPVILLAMLQTETTATARLMRQKTMTRLFKNA